MEITSPTQTGTAARATSATPPSGGSVLSSDFETFLKMLTTQMQNQDPLNPVDSADFAVQLATFSTVEQQVRTNDLLTSLGDRMGALSVGQLSGWVGMDARAKMPVQFDGNPVSMSAHIDDAATAAQLVVTNAQGIVVQRQDLALGSTDIQWVGEDVAGIPLPDGIYKIAVESFSGDNLIASHQVEIHSRIIEARSENGAPVLYMENGQQVPASLVLGLRQPDT